MSSMKIILEFCPNPGVPCKVQANLTRCTLWKPVLGIQKILTNLTLLEGLFSKNFSTIVPYKGQRFPEISDWSNQDPFSKPWKKCDRMNPQLHN